MSLVIPVTAALLVLRLVGELMLSALNRAEVRRHAASAPPAVAAIMDAETYAKSVAYTLAKSRYGVVSGVFDTVVLAVVLFSGGLPALYRAVMSWGAAGAGWTQTLFVLIAMVLLSLPSIPFEWWEQFRLEEKFGFNKSTFGLWVTDKIKGTVLTFAIGFPLLWALLSLVKWTGEAWWMWGFALVFGFQLLMLVLYPKLILPLFNKLLVRHRNGASQH
jgi:STE24 endopeptidase